MRFRSMSTLTTLVLLASVAACGSDDDTGLGLGSSIGGNGSGGQAAGTSAKGGSSGGAEAGGEQGAGAGGKEAKGGASGGGGTSGQGGKGGAAGTADNGGGAGADAGKGGTGGSAIGPQPGDVPQTCEEAAAARGTLGCSFRAVDLPNEPDSSFGEGAAKAAWGLVLGNPGDDVATVAITRLGADGKTQILSNETVPAGGSVSVSLASYEVNGVEAGVVGSSARSTRSVRVVSDVPIAVVQLNTLAPGSSSADGSVLFPEIALGKTYIVAGWPAANGYKPTFEAKGLPDHAYVTIVAGDAVAEVSVTPTFDVAASASVVGIPAKTKASYTLAPWEVLHLATGVLVPPSSGSAKPVDLSGTTIEADVPVAVFVGNERGSVAKVKGMPQPPGGSSDGTCCTDHLEEQLAPAESLGTRFFVAKSPLRSTGGFVEGDVVRFVGGAEASTVRTSLPGLASFALEKAEVKDVVIVADLLVEATAGIQIAQLIASKEATNVSIGDPALTMVPPISAYLRRQVAVLPSQSWAKTYVTLAAEEGTTFTVDGAPLSGCVVRPAVSLAGVAATYVSLVCPVTGVLAIDGSAPFGVIAYGYGEAVSFAYAVTSGLGDAAP